MNARLFSYFVFSFVLVTMSASTATSQTKAKPDFTGTWLLDQKKSNEPGLTNRPDLPIKISHPEPEFRVTRQSEANGQIIETDFVYFTDGRGEENQMTSLLTTNPSAAKADDLKNKVTKSKTTWSDKKIVTRTKLQLTVGGHFVEFEQVDEWKISNDGRVLTQTSRVIFQNSNNAFVPAMAQEKKRVYNRL
jgi:hypothetical protein